MAANRFQHLPVTIEHALYAGALPRHHDDPFDRMLVAQALPEKLTIITRDKFIPAYNPNKKGSDLFFVKTNGKDLQLGISANRVELFFFFAFSDTDAQVFRQKTSSHPIDNRNSSHL